MHAPLGRQGHKRCQEQRRIVSRVRATCRGARRGQSKARRRQRTGNKLEARPDPAAKSLEYQARGRGLPPGAAEGPLLDSSRESGLPRRVAGVTNPPANTGDRQVRSLGCRIPWRRRWHLVPVFLPGKSHGWRSLAGYRGRGVTKGRTRLSD